MSDMSVPRRILRPSLALGAVAVAVGATLTAAAPAGAATGTPIVYSETAQASGTLDGVSFTNATVTMQQTSNTADVTNQGTGFPQNRTGTITVTVAGVGSDTVDATNSYVNQAYQGSAVFGFNGGSGFGWWVTNASFSSYNLDRAFGPISGPGSTNRRGATTSRGGFLLTSSGSVTFQAVIPSS